MYTLVKQTNKWDFRIDGFEINVKRLGTQEIIVD